MRKPEQVEQLYIDFDNFFASVEQQARPGLRDRPVGVIPFSGTEHTICIAVSREAKAAGVRTGTPLTEARELCPDIIFQRQTPELYVRAHHALRSAINQSTPVTGICSIDEMSCDVSPMWRKEPEALGEQIKRSLRDNIGPYITGSIGIAPNRHLAKLVCKWKKPDGLTVLSPEAMPGGLLDMPFADVAGIGPRMEKRLIRAGLSEMIDLWNAQPKQLRDIWGSVAGERFWYLLHGYDVPGEDTHRRMFGHGRVLPPDHRTLDKARNYSIFLALKASRRMRAEGFRAGKVWLGLSCRAGHWGREKTLPIVNDDQACLAGLNALWVQAREALPRNSVVVRIRCAFLDLWKGTRQLNLFLDDADRRQKWETITSAIDILNDRYDRQLISVGPLTPPPGQYAGAKIAYTRIPDFRDFDTSDFH